MIEKDKKRKISLSPHKEAIPKWGGGLFIQFYLNLEQYIPFSFNQDLIIQIDKKNIIIFLKNDINFNQ